MIATIVAVDKDWGIGYQGQLLEYLPPDMKYFKDITSGSAVIMGRKTWDSLPKKPLPNRLNIVISNKKNVILNKETIRMSLDDLLLIINDIQYDLFIIGGGEIYKQLLPYCDRVYVTLIEKSHDNVDTYFPNLDKDPNWEIETCTELRDYNGIPYAFLVYERV